jgi:hypothetical protein
MQLVIKKTIQKKRQRNHAMLLRSQLKTAIILHFLFLFFKIKIGLSTHILYILIRKSCKYFFS